MTIEITTAATGSTGAMNEYATYQPELYVDTRIIYTSTSSLLADDDGRVAIDYLKVHFVEGCYDLNIVVATGIEDANGNEYVDYLVHANSAALDLEAVYTITNDASCTITRTAYIKPQGYAESSWTALDSGTYPFITLKTSPATSKGVTVDQQLTSNEFDTPEFFDVWIKVSGDSTYSSHAEANVTFTLKMSQACQVNELTCASTPEIANFAYEVPIQVSTAPLTVVTSASTCTSSVTLSPSGSCVLTNSLEAWDAGTIGADSDRAWIPVL